MSKHPLDPMAAAMLKTPQDRTAAAATAAGAAATTPAESGGSTDDSATDPATEADQSEDTLLSERFEEQCFLLDAIDLFKKTAISNKNSYKNFIVLDGAKDDAAKLVSKINSRFAPGLKSFMNITPAQYSMMVPKIRLFVQKFVGEKDKVGVFQELKFKDWTSKSSIEEITKTRTNRGDDAGLISFSYEYDGRDPASTTNMIKANLRMLFTDFDTITRPIRTNLTEKEDGMLKQGGAKEFLQPRFLDLILRQPASKKVAGSSLPYLIKVHAEIGWQEPTDTTGTVFPEDLKQYIRSGYLNEYLTLYMLEHDLDFKDDGRIEMSIDFRASLENVLFNNTDILALDEDTETKFKEQLAKERAQLAKNKEIVADAAKRRAAAEKRGDGEGEGVTTVDNSGETAAEEGAALANDKRQKDENAGRAGRLVSGDELANGSRAAAIEAPPPDTSTSATGADELSKLIKLKERQLEYTVQRQKTARYRKLLNSLSSSGKIKFVDLNSADVKTWLQQLTAANMSETEGDSGRVRASAIMQKTAGTTEQTASTAEVEKTALNAAKKAAAAKKNAAGKAVQDAKDGEDGEDGKTEKSKSDLEFDSAAADKVNGPDVYRIHYMYLGDIIDITCDTLYNLDGALGITRIVSGPVQYFNGDGKLADINLADIPVSLDTFSNWLYRNIISKGLTSMSLGTFLNRLTTDLVFEALGGKKCFNSISGTPSMMMTPIVLNLHGAGKHREEVITRDTATTNYPRVDIKKFVTLAKNNLGSRGDLASNERVNTATYIFLTGVVREENNFNYGYGGFDFDGSKDGIYTLGIGRDRGIVKNIKFNKSSAKYQSEMRIEQRDSNKGSVLGEFRQVYNASVTLLGNTLFKNGQYVKLHIQQHR